jgi:nicotinamidase-related amidase
MLTWSYCKKYKNYLEAEKTMKTRFEDIVNEGSIGLRENPIPSNELLAKAGEEILTSSFIDKTRVLLVLIDFQNDFMPKGALGVPGADKDISRISKWIYENMEQVTKIAASIDTHIPHQIFHPCWWVDKNDKHPEPFTQITLKEVNDGTWTPVISPVKSIDYVENLEKLGRKLLNIWPYHCLQGTFGHSIEGQLGNMIYFHSVAKRSVPIRLTKGNYPLSEMYGILKGEYDPKNRINLDFLNKIAEYDYVTIAGEAKSHCVLETIRQVLDHYQGNLDVTNKIYILEDCMSTIPGFEDDTKKAFESFEKKHKVNLVNSTSFNLEEVMKK